jgi:hypothetical protein
MSSSQPESLQNLYLERKEEKERKRLKILYSLMAGSIAIQTLGASMYKIQALTVGKNNELWKHPYWTASLTTIGELLAFVVYFAKEKIFKKKRALKSYEG